MAARTSAQQLLAWGKEHGSFILGSAALGISTVGGVIAAMKYVEQLKLHGEQLKMHVQRLEKEVAHERELRTEEVAHERELRKEVERRLEQRTDLVVKNQLFDILHHADYEAATRLLHGSQASSAARPSTD